MAQAQTMFPVLDSFIQKEAEQIVVYPNNSYCPIIKRTRFGYRQQHMLSQLMYDTLGKTTSPVMIKSRPVFAVGQELAVGLTT